MPKNEEITVMRRYTQKVSATLLTSACASKPLPEWWLSHASHPNQMGGIWLLWQQIPTKSAVCQRRRTEYRPPRRPHQSHWMTGNIPSTAIAYTIKKSPSIKKIDQFTFGDHSMIFTVGNSCNATAFPKRNDAKNWKRIFLKWILTKRKILGVYN